MLPGILKKKKKYFALIGTQKVPRTVLMGVSILHSFTFSPKKTQKSLRQGKDCSVLDPAWPRDLTGGHSFSCPIVHVIVDLATLTLVSQGHKPKNPGSMRWGKGQP